MASYQQRNQYRKRSKKQFHNHIGHENSSPRAQSWARNKMRRGTKWSQHVGGPCDSDIPPRQRRYPHYGQKRKFKHRIGGHHHYVPSRPSSAHSVHHHGVHHHGVHNVQSAQTVQSVQTAQSVATAGCSDRESTVSASPVSVQSAGLEPQQLVLSKEDSVQSNTSGGTTNTTNTTNSQKSSSKSSRTSYTDIVQQAEQSKDHSKEQSKEQSKNPEDLEDEAVFLNVNNRKKMMFYQRKTPTPPPSGATMDLD